MEFQKTPGWLDWYAGPSKPKFKLPAGAVDSHCHVFGPGAEFPYAPERKYTPCDASKQQLYALRDHLGFARNVVVGASCHGADNRATVDALLKSNGKARGVATVKRSVTDEELRAMNEAGVRGVRFNFVKHLGAPPSLADFQRVTDVIAPFGWHAVAHLSADDLETALPYLKPLEIPFVIDHLARINAAAGLDQAPFQKLLELTTNPLAWVKISGIDRASTAGTPFHDVVPFAQKLVAAAPDRILWGTDWPHPNIKYPVPGDQGLVDLLSVAVPDAKARARILVDNPAQLYGF